MGLRDAALAAAVPNVDSSSPLRNAANAARGDVAASAREFESILLGQWLQAAESSFATVAGTDDDQSSQDEQMKSYGVQQLANALSRAGGIGIATMVSKALEHTAGERTSDVQTKLLSSR